MLLSNLVHNNTFYIILNWCPTYFHDSYPDARVSAQFTILSPLSLSACVIVHAGGEWTVLSCLRSASLHSNLGGLVNDWLGIAALWGHGGSRLVFRMDALRRT